MPLYKRQVRGTQNLQYHPYKTRTKIQNVKPNKTTIGRAENIGNPADHVVSGLLYFSPCSKLYNLVKMVFPRLIFQLLSWELTLHNNNMLIKHLKLCTHAYLKILLP